MASPSKYTPVRIALPFCTGIIFSLTIAKGYSPETSIWVCCLFFSSYIIFYKISHNSFRFRWLPGVLAQLNLFVAGISLVSILNRTDQDRDFIIEKYQEQAVLCRIDEKPVARPASFSCKVTVLALIDSSRTFHSINTGLLLNFRNDSTCASLLPGDVILLRSGLQQIKGPANPGIFDYRRYLFFNRIRWQAYAGPGQWAQLQGYRVNGFKRWSQECRSKFHETLRRFKIEGNDLALASGLILGDKQLLENDIIRAFSNAGAMHVLSVSGLHVGIMYVLADRLLFFMKRGRYGRKIQQCIIIAMIWAYAFLTGLPPSVVRASLMFSLIATANMMNRSHDGFNILAGAAFIQLWMNPYDIMNVGFQLSYLAVLGIFMFYKQLNSWFSDSKRLTSWIWSVVAVSLAAQLATFPLTSYYFHFFPVYFLITNMVVVPLAGVVVYLALFVLAAGGLGINLIWLGFPLKWSLQFMQQSVGFIQSWPGGVINQLYLNDYQVIFTFLAILGLYLWTEASYRKGPYMLLSAIFVVFLISGLNKLEKTGRAQVSVYHITGHTAIDLVYKSKSLFISDSTLMDYPAKISYNILPNRELMAVKEVSEVKIEEKVLRQAENAWFMYPFVYFLDKKIVIIDENWEPKVYMGKIPVDLAIFRGKRGPLLSETIQVLEIKQCIIDGSVPRYRAETLITEAVELRLPCHSTWQNGGYVLEW